ncbi:MAG: HEPN domain-containing protein [Myxococcales bacterium]|nr:HEPN domain-containing protein [Myxococcales bacterium]
MAEQNPKQEVANELARARQALQSAEALLGLGLFADSVSRSYYAALHLMRALLFTRGVEPQTPEGAIPLFNTELVQRGVFSSGHSRSLAGLQRARELADYDAAVAFSPEVARQCLEDSRAFAVEALAFLSGEGWIAPKT